MNPSIPPDVVPSQGGRDVRPPALSADQLLPPVEPPSAGFILQLFVIPAIIVAAVVFLWFVIESLARRGEQNPDEIVAALRSSNQARFQRANELADMLRTPQRYPELKVNRELAQKLAALLSEQVDAADDAEAAVTMRFFLATALGEFHVADGLPVLTKAARTDADRDVRRRAVNAIAALAGAMASLKPPQPIVDDDVTEAVLELANEQDELIRSETAFAIGVLAAAPGADPRLASELEALADDPYTDARFNAAAGLARIGSPLAAPAVAEMLDPELIESSVAGEKAMTEDVTKAALWKQKGFKRKTIIKNALLAVQQLVDKRSLPAETFTVLDGALATFLAWVPTMDEPEKVREEIADAATRMQAKVRGRLQAQP